MNTLRSFCLAVAVAPLASTAASAQPAALGATIGLPQVLHADNGAVLAWRRLALHLEAGAIEAGVGLPLCLAPLRAATLPATGERAACASADAGMRSSVENPDVEVRARWRLGDLPGSLLALGLRAEGTGTSATFELRHASAAWRASLGFARPLHLGAGGEAWGGPYAELQWPAGTRLHWRFVLDDAREWRRGERDRSASLALSSSVGDARWRVRVVRSLDVREAPWRLGAAADWRF